MKQILIALCCFLNFLPVLGQENFREENLEIDKYIEGSLILPSKEEAKNLVIFIQGSGPTDRNGNQPMGKNDGAKKLARELAENGIASFRFDKRIFKMNELKIKEDDLRFDDFVTDTKSIIRYFKERDIFENIILLGHSQGSLVGILSAEEDVDALISIAGAGQPIDKIIVEQISKMAPPLADNARTAFDEIRENGRTQNYSPILETMFKPSIQPFMHSWMKYDPSREIAKLDVPVLIINGTSDIQVETSEAEKLKAANNKAQLVILEDMNHIFRKIESDDRLVNTKSYNEPNQPLHPELAPAIIKFIKEIE